MVSIKERCEERGWSAEDLCGRLNRIVKDPEFVRVYKDYEKNSRWDVKKARQVSAYQVKRWVNGETNPEGVSLLTLRYVLGDDIQVGSKRGGGSKIKAPTRNVVVKPIKEDVVDNSVDNLEVIKVDWFTKCVLENMARDMKKTPGELVAAMVANKIDIPDYVEDLKKLGYKESVCHILDEGFKTNKIKFFGIAKHRG